MIDISSLHVVISNYIFHIMLNSSITRYGISHLLRQILKFVNIRSLGRGLTCLVTQNSYTQVEPVGWAKWGQV